MEVGRVGRGDWGEGLPPGVPEILLQPRPFILAALPVKRDDSLRQVTRTARVGRASWLRVTYHATRPGVPLPFGADRSLLAWVTTKAFATGEVRFSAITEYFRAFGLDAGGKGYRLFRQRFERIASLALEIEEIDETEKRVRHLVLIPEAAEPLALLEPGRQAGQSDPRLLAYQRYGFELDRDFWSYLRETRVPTPTALLRRFHRRPLAWDFTQLLLHRCYAARSAAIVPFPQLCAQLGSTDKDPRRLRARLRRILAELVELYPDCPVRIERGGDLRVEPWKASSPPRSPSPGPPTPTLRERGRPEKGALPVPPSASGTPLPEGRSGRAGRGAGVREDAPPGCPDPRDMWRQLRLALKQAPVREPRHRPHFVPHRPTTTSADDGARPPPGPAAG
ncbi:MAG TPA: hypothetical protein VF017_23675 [Thermoanaerobaculia bacterium]|nr:hypothetical protein [Thermoanaerobaculia bacterium]